MVVVVVRHAHREKPQGGRLDNGLSPKGHRQTTRLTKALRRRLAEHRLIHLYSSPKRRCLETLRPLAEKLGKEIDVRPSLDEGEGIDPKKGVREFMKVLNARKKGCVVICGHGDWIRAFFEIASGVRAKLEKGGWTEFEREARGKRYSIRAIVPEELN